MLAADDERFALPEGDARLDDGVGIAPELIRFEELLRLHGWTLAVRAGDPLF
jgi:hypothetical protein